MLTSISFSGLPIRLIPFSNMRATGVLVVWQRFFALSILPSRM